MSALNISYYLKTKKQQAELKRELRDSLSERTNSMGIQSRNIENDTVSAQFHLETDSPHDWSNDKVTVRASLLEPDTFTLRIEAVSDYFDTKEQLVLFFNDDVRQEIVNALENVVVHKVEN